MKIALALALLAAFPAATRAKSASTAPLEPAPTVATLGECQACGKHIYFGETCVSCILASKHVERSHPCESCEKPILFGEHCAGCALLRAKANFAHPCSSCESTIYVGKRCPACATSHFQQGLRGALERATAAGSRLGAGAQARLRALFPEDEELRAAELQAIETQEASWLGRAKEWTKSTGASIAEDVTDLEVRRRAGMAVGAALEVAASVEATKRRLAEAGIGRALELPVKSELGWTSLGDLATAKLLALAPALVGTDLAEDPAAVLAAFVVVDPLAFVMDLELVPSENGPLTILDALAAKSTTDPTAAVACLSILEATRRLQRGEDITRSLRDISRALEVLAPEDGGLAPEGAESEPMPKTPDGSR